MQLGKDMSYYKIYKYNYKLDYKIIYIEFLIFLLSF